ncbi:MAG: glycosyltransferase family A protein [Acidobacteriota bacterium]|nr:glycosyltransferase family A protein [Acidobacteriota bacterium]
MNATISVVIPARNAGRTIGETLESVRLQTHKPDEVVLVDDGSLDDTVAVAFRAFPGIRILRQPPAGVSRARNRGAEAATGAFIAFLDADDLWESAKLERQLERAAGDDAPHIVLCKMQNFLSPELAGKQGVSEGDLEVRTGYSAGCVFMARTDFLETGGFPEDREFYETVEWFERARARGYREAIVDEVLMLRRIHAGNTMLRRSTDARAAYMRLIAERLKARR